MFNFRRHSNITHTAICIREEKTPKIIPGSTTDYIVGTAGILAIVGTVFLVGKKIADGMIEAVEAA